MTIIINDKNILMSECEIFKLPSIFSVVSGLWYLKVIDIKKLLNCDIKEDCHYKAVKVVL